MGGIIPYYTHPGRLGRRDTHPIPILVYPRWCIYPVYASSCTPFVGSPPVHAGTLHDTAGRHVHGLGVTMCTFSRESVGERVPSESLLP